MQSPVQETNELLKEFEELIKQIGREVSEESIVPTIRDLIERWQNSVSDSEKKLSHTVDRIAENFELLKKTIPEASHLINSFTYELTHGKMLFDELNKSVSTLNQAVSYFLSKLKMIDDYTKHLESAISSLENIKAETRAIKNDIKKTINELSNENAIVHQILEQIETSLKELAKQNIAISNKISTLSFFSMFLGISIIFLLFYLF